MRGRITVLENTDWKGGDREENMMLKCVLCFASFCLAQPSPTEPYLSTSLGTYDPSRVELAIS